MKTVSYTSNAYSDESQSFAYGRYTRKMERLGELQENMMQFVLAASLVKV